MKKTLTIEFNFGYKDWICSKVRYGVRFNATWIGFSIVMSEKHETERKVKNMVWLESIK